MIATGRELLLKLNINDFQPPKMLANGSLQTVVGYYWPDPVSDREDYITHTVALPDSDRLLVMEYKSQAPVKSDRIILFLHGLGGCFQSRYVMRISNKLNQRGYDTFRINLRGCGPGQGLAKNPYHSGRSEDLRAVLEYITALYPQRPVTVLGFSLGGNITLKAAGEDASNPTGKWDSFISVCAPIHLNRSIQVLEKKKNIFFNKFFTRLVKQQIHHTHKAYFEELGPPQLDEIRTLYQLDDNYTAPRSGFKNAEDYYSKASSFDLISKIHIKGLLLTALDDPVVDTSAYLDLPDNPVLDKIYTRYGGHLGYFHKMKTPDRRWMDEVIVNYIAHLEASLILGGRYHGPVGGPYQT